MMNAEITIILICNNIMKVVRYVGKDINSLSKVLSKLSNSVHYKGWEVLHINTTVATASPDLADALEKTQVLKVFELTKRVGSAYNLEGEALREMVIMSISSDVSHFQRRSKSHYTTADLLDKLY